MGLKEPWGAEKVEFRLGEGEVRVRVALPWELPKSDLEHFVNNSYGAVAARLAGQVAVTAMRGRSHD